MSKDATLNAALEYLDEGLSVIPIHAETKRPAIKWRDYQSRLPTEEEVTDWFTTWPKRTSLSSQEKYQASSLLTAIMMLRSMRRLAAECARPSSYRPREVATFGSSILAMGRDGARELGIIPLVRTGQERRGWISEATEATRFYRLLRGTGGRLLVT